jgi:ASC-1-like (ASCH) protein
MAFPGHLPLQNPDSGEEKQELSEHEGELLDKVARKVVHWKMSVPAIIALESVKPLNYIGSQAMVFFEPIVQAVFNFKEYDTFRMMMERRDTIEHLLQRMEHYDAFSARKEKLYKKLKKQYLKTQSFGLRFKSAILGFKVPPHLHDEWKARFDAIDAEAEAAHPAKQPPPESDSETSS